MLHSVKAGMDSRQKDVEIDAQKERESGHAALGAENRVD